MHSIMGDTVGQHNKNVELILAFPLHSKKQTLDLGMFFKLVQCTNKISISTKV